MPLEPGTSVDRFRLMELLGEGGQASVWRAQDPLNLRRDVALKMVHITGTPTSHVERVRREARALARLDHPSLVKCHGLFEDLKTETLGLVLDFVDGQSLDQASGDGRLSAEHRDALLLHTADALAYLHREGVVHRDLKLENIIVAEGFWASPEDPSCIKLVDFGIAASIGKPSGLTAVGHIVGTPAYMAPELLDPGHFGGQGPTPAADVFAFGVVAWKLLFGGHPTGLPPESSVVDYALQYRTAHSTTPPWSTRMPPGPWAVLISACLEPHRSRRLQDGETLVRLCADVRAGRVPDATMLSAKAAKLPNTLDDAAMTPIFGEGRATVPMGPTARATEDANSKSERGQTEPSAPAPDLFAHAPANEQPQGASRIHEQRTTAADRSNNWRFGVEFVAVAAGALLVAAVGVALVIVSLGADERELTPTPRPATTQHATTQAGVSEPNATPQTATTQVAPAAETAEPAAPAVDPSLPTKCSGTDPLCACCPSERSCGPGACSDILPSNAEFSLRLWSVRSPGSRAPLLTDPHVRVCFSKAADPAASACTRLRDTLGGRMTDALHITTADLTRSGILIKVTGQDWRAEHVGKHSLGLRRAALCSGVLFAGFGEKEVDSVLFYLDDPANEPSVHKCQSSHGEVAVAPADRGLADKPGGWAWGDRCFGHVKSGAYGWARAACDQALAENPASPNPRASILYNLAMAEQGRGNNRVARRFYQQSLEVRPHDEVQAGLDNLDVP